MVKAADRFRISTAAVAAIVNAFMVNIGIVTEENPNKLIDCSTINRQRAKCRKENKPDKTNLTGLYVDCKTDNTIQIDKTMKMKYHLTMLNEPGSKYICHTTTAGNKAVDLCRSIVNAIEPEELKKILVLGADGTNSNTGRFGGCIHLLEKKINRKCVSLECL